MNKKTTTITMVIVALVTLAIVATVIIFAVKNGKQPEGPVGHSGNVTTPIDKPNDPDPVIPPIDSDSGTETDKPEDSSPADITVDVVRSKDDPHEDTPGVVGDVIIQPGIKEGEE